MHEQNATETELRAAFRDAGLWRDGWTFERAQACPMVWQSLNNMVRARRRNAERAGKPIPAQLALIAKVTGAPALSASPRGLTG